MAQLVEHANSGQEVVGSIPAPYWLGRCHYNVTVIISPLSLYGSTQSREPVSC